MPNIFTFHKKWSQYVAVPVFVCDRNASVLIISSWLALKYFIFFHFIMVTNIPFLNSVNVFTLNCLLWLHITVWPCSDELQFIFQEIIYENIQYSNITRISIFLSVIVNVTHLWILKYSYCPILINLAYYCTKLIQFFFGLLWPKFL